jgi:hypothetical protein
MWEYLKFEPWSEQNLQGVCKKITFVKGGFIGTVAEYYVLDYIIWKHCGVSDIEKMYVTCKPKIDVMTQRFLFVGNVLGAPLVKMKSFWLGLGGYAEIYSYSPGGEFHHKVKDIIPFVDFALEHAEKLSGSEMIEALTSSPSPK